MTKAEFKEFIHPLTLAQVGEMTGTPLRTIEGWNNGRYPVPAWFSVNITNNMIKDYLKEKGK